jgi:hypothetical protein
LFTNSIFTYIIYGFCLCINNSRWGYKYNGLVYFIWLVIA